MDIIVSAPGKVIIHGEHAVVYGKTAIAASLNLRTYVHLIRTEDSLLHFNVPSLQLKQSWETRDLMQITEMYKVDVMHPTPPQEDLLQAINKIACDHASGDVISRANLTLLYLYTAICGTSSQLPAINVTITSKLPIGAGLGSSASFSVALSAALLLLQNCIQAARHSDSVFKDDDLRVINEWAYCGERIMHGNPSGIDNSVITYGGVIKYHSGILEKLIKVPKFKILLTDTKVARSTKDLVGIVRNKYEKYPSIMKPILEAVDAISVTFLQILQTSLANDSQNNEAFYSSFEELIDINQALLKAFGVSHVAIDRICHVTSKNNFHSKLTGAGGGGCVLTILRPDVMAEDIQKLKNELSEEGFECRETEIGGTGIMIHADGIIYG